MHAALWTLTALRLRGLGRRFVQSLGTVQGLAFLGLAASVVALWLAPLFLLPLVNNPLFQLTPEMIGSLAPPALLGACLLTVILGDDKAMRFTPAEVDFLFPAPFTRQQLMTYKLTENTLGAALAALFFFVWLVPYVPMPVAAFWGVFQAMLFIQLFQVVVTLLGQTLMSKLQTVSRWPVAIAGGVLIVCLVGPAIALLSGNGGSWQGWQSFRYGMIGDVLFSPFELFSQTMIAARWADLFVWGGCALGVNVILLSLIVRLDQYYVEAALASSQRFLVMVQRIQRGGVLSLWGSPLRYRLPKLPRLGGLGTLAWRQFVSAARSLPTLLSIAAVILFVVAAPGLLLRLESGNLFEATNIAVTAAIMQLTLVFTMMLRFDFRGDLDQIDWLKMLPLGPLAITAGQLCVPVCIASLVQGLLLIGVAAATSDEMFRQGLWSLLAFVPPLNLLLFGLENFLFLMFPSRSVAFNPGDLQGFGQQVVLFLVKTLVMVFCCALAITTAVVMVFYFDLGILASSVAAWSILALLALATVPAVAWAFRRFDPSLDRAVE